jgi:hypothetical protein
VNAPVVRWNRLVPGFLIAVLAVTGAWWSMRARAAPGNAPSSSPVRVFLLSPTNGKELQAGEYLPVRLQAIAPGAIAESELFVDGLSLGAVRESPENASWTWQAWQPGIHALYARAATAEGDIGRSPTVIVNVLAGNDTIEVLAEGGQTLQQIGSFLGIAPVAMAHANPQLDPNPSLPLQAGVRVQVPVPRGGPQTEPSAQAVVSGPPLLSILWNIELRAAVDRSYCYASDGSGAWGRLPRDASIFFEGAEGAYTQLIPSAPTGQIDVECWGWLEDDLQLLGDGHAVFDIAESPGSVVIRGGGFDLTGALSIPSLPPAIAGLAARIPAPYGVRKPLNAADCEAHGLPADQCDFLLNTAHPAYLVLEWEWRAPFCLGTACAQVRQIDGYRLYVLDPATGDSSLASEIAPRGERVGVYPLASESRCYGVRAFVSTPAFAESELAVHCPGPPNSETRVMEPEHWLTTGQLNEAWYDAFEVPSGAVIVSASNYGNEVRSSAGVKFDPQPLPAGGVLHRAALRFIVLFLQADTGGPASALDSFCVSTLGRATQDWSGLSGGENHYVTGLNLLASPEYDAPMVSLPEFVGRTVEVDVTPLVSAWLQDPSRNHGLILAPRPASTAGTEGGAFCNSVEGDFRLEIEYLMP